MIPVSNLLREAARYSRTLSSRCDVYYGTVMIHADAHVVTGSYTCERGNKVRLNAKVTLAVEETALTTVDTWHTRFKLYRGIESIGYSERFQLGDFRVDEVSRSEDGLIELTGSGLENYIIDARFIRPRTPPYGASTVHTISDLIREIMPTVDIRIMTTRDAPVRATAPWDVERWDAVEALAGSIDCEVYAGSTGEFFIADVPDLVTGVPVYFVNEGAGGVLVGRSEKDTRDQVYNAVSASGSSSDPNVPPVWGWAYDDDPTSPTYYFADPLAGGFGQVPRFHASQFYNTDEQCVRAAQGMLAQSLAANKTLSFETIPLAFLEAGDTVTAELRDHTQENHLLQKTDCTLEIDGAMKCETLSSKVIARAVL